ncbi:MAG TPA: ATP phosphoribosyltransferase [Actinomycetota bacterium]|jgi:ATP phosphoribosyltransferase|nr:ATP phosphoribosyltransferase [Actinomycetota bacterium]
MLKLVVPKGSLERATLELFEDADLKIWRGSEREYRGSVEDPRIDSVMVLRPQEIPSYVEDGFFDIGVTGEDWVAETGADVIKVTPLEYSKNTDRPVKVVLAAPRDAGLNSPSDIKPESRISTEYPNLTRRYFEELGIPVRVLLSYGATEAKVPAIVDAIVDVTETGSTLRRNGMEILDVILESRTQLIANPRAWEEPEKRQAIEELKILLRGAVDARGRVMVKLNVEEHNLDGVVELLPAMRAPTVSRLAEPGYFAVETIVSKSAINTLIPKLKALGAEDIIELPITKIVP